MQPHKIIIFSLLLLAGCGNPGGVSDSTYAEFKELGAPKILFSCTRTPTIDAQAVLNCMKNDLGPTKENACLDQAKSAANVPVIDVAFVAGVGPGATYNKILNDAKSKCESVSPLLFSDAKFNVLEKQQ